MVAMRFSGIDGARADTAKAIFAMCYGLKMIWVDAAMDAALVVDFQSRRDWAADDFIDIPMCEDFLSSNIGYAIAVAINGASPQPTATIGLRKNIRLSALSRRKPDHRCSG